MPARSIASATISFGLVAIPVKLFTATSSQQVRFNMLDPDTKGRVRQQYIAAESGEVVDRGSLVKGYEYAKGQYVIFSNEELSALETQRSTSLDIVEFVPLTTVDLLQVEKTYYLGPDKGGDKAYRLLTESMQQSGKVAVGRWAARGKEQLVLLRPYKDGLLLHQLFYPNEVRSFEEVDTGATFDFKEVERDLALKLIHELSSEAFDPARYEDTYAARVLAAVEKKVRGQEIHAAPEVPKAQVVDLFEALKQSLSEAQQGAGPGAAAREDAEKSDDEVSPRPVRKAEVQKKESRKRTGS